MEERLLSEIRGFLDENGRVKSLPAKRKKLNCVLFYLAEKLDAKAIYTEREINEAINEWTLFRDAATLRRELYNKRFLDRKADGRAYWLEENQPSPEDFEL